MAELTREQKGAIDREARRIHHCTKDYCWGPTTQELAEAKHRLLSAAELEEMAANTLAGLIKDAPSSPRQSERSNGE